MNSGAGEVANTGFRPEVRGFDSLRLHSKEVAVNAQQAVVVPAVLSSVVFGPRSRYRLDEFRGRDGAVEWMVLDVERPDAVAGLPASVIAQEPTRDRAIRAALYVGALAADKAYSAELARVYGKAAGDARYSYEPHADERCQAAREAFREATDLWRGDSVVPGLGVKVSK
jgi:hypothetical protein